MELQVQDPDPPSFPAPTPQSAPLAEIAFDASAKNLAVALLLILSSITSFAVVIQKAVTSRCSVVMTMTLFSSAEGRIDLHAGF